MRSCRSWASGELSGIFFIWVNATVTRHGAIRKPDENGCRTDHPTVFIYRSRNLWARLLSPTKAICFAGRNFATASGISVNEMNNEHNSARMIEAPVSETISRDLFVCRIPAARR